MSLLQLLMSPTGLAFDRWLVRWTGYSLLNPVFAREAGFKPQPPLLLETTGRRSGKVRGAALPYFDINGKLLVVGSKGGLPTDPAWVTNLRAEPRVAIYIKRKRQQRLARIATGPERALLWQELLRRVPTYAHYQSLTTREIPIVILDSAPLPAFGHPLPADGGERGNPSKQE